MKLELLRQAAAGQAFCLARLRFAFERDRGVLRVAIAGSDDLRDWWRNLSLHLVEWPGGCCGLVHLGFWESAEILHRFFWSRSRGHRVELYGHSLGGAVAALLGLALSESGRHVDHVVQLGAPRVGDHDFGAAYPIPVTSYRCGLDPVPHVPLFGRRLYGGHRGEWIAYSPLAPLQTLTSPAPWWSPLTDHSLESYCSALGLEST